MTPTSAGADELPELEALPELLPEPEPEPLPEPDPDEPLPSSVTPLLLSSSPQAAAKSMRDMTAPSSRIRRDIDFSLDTNNWEK
ncbi:MAG: hypothetical protein VXX74_07025, partial [Actinomycetota bacterium]|nr:hypothetical protein [Actinomycetota bacterium]